MDEYKNSALIVIDMQYDLCNGGPMAHENSFEIIPEINRIRNKYSHIIFIKKSYAKNHSCFKKYGGKHPEHCIENTHGERIHGEIIISNNDFVIGRGSLQKYDSNSAFYDAEDIKKETKLLSILNINKVNTLYFCGNGFDTIIFSTIMDALNYKFECIVIKNAITCINKKKSDEYMKFLVSMGIKII